MSEQLTYSYTVLRYVHDVVAGEFLNVGIVIYSPSRWFLKTRTQKSVGRLRGAFPNIDLFAFRRAMEAIDRGVSALAEEIGQGPLFEGHLNARICALKVLPEDDSCLQWSPVGSGLTEDLEGTMERLYARYVTQYDKASRKKRTDRDIWRPVRRGLAERGVKVPFQEKLVFGSQDSIKFKSAWRNGAWHAYEAVSLDLADGERIKNKARRWRGHLSAVKEGSDEDLQLHFLVGRPGQDALLPEFENAKKILVGSPFACEVVDENDTDELVASIEQAYRETTVQGRGCRFPG